MSKARELPNYTAYNNVDANIVDNTSIYKSTQWKHAKTSMDIEALHRKSIWNVPMGQKLDIPREGLNRLGRFAIPYREQPDNGGRNLDSILAGGTSTPKVAERFIMKRPRDPRLYLPS